MNKKDHKFRITPDMIPRASDYIDVHNAQRPDEKQLKKFQKSEKYRQYVKRYDKGRKWRRIKSFFSWMDGKWLAIMGLILTFISVLPTILKF